VDLTFPHHENEIAQSEAFFGVQVLAYGALSY
jgi:cysteinyl-tRNA synthetase